MYDIEQVIASIQANHRISCFIIATGINQNQEWIKKRFSRLPKGNPVMIHWINPRLLCIPNKRNAIQHKIDIHIVILGKTYVQRQYVFAKIDNS
jgi:hypothetical protein